MKFIPGIKISNCVDCPYIGHIGRFTEGGAKPCCDHHKIVHKNPNCFKRVIPYRTDFNSFVPIRKPRAIPEWCPLENV